MGIVPQFIFGGNTGIASAQDLERQRMLVAELQRPRSAPKNAGEGLSALGEALGYRMARKRLEKGEKQGMEAGQALFDSLFGGTTEISSPTEAQPATYAPDEVQPSFAEKFAESMPPQEGEIPAVPMAGEPGADMTQAQPVPEPQPVQQPQQAPAETMDLRTMLQVRRDPRWQYLDDGQKKFIDGRIDEELKRRARANDPEYNLGLEKLRLEVEGLRNPELKGTEYGLQPIITQDADGKYHLFQASKSGGPPKEIELPYGWTPRQQFLDTGTGFQPMPVQGAPNPQMAPIPKNVAEEAALKKVGADKGEAAALYESLSSKMPGLQKVVSELDVLADQATYTTAGQLRDYGMKELGMEPTESAVARAKYVAMVDNQVLPMLRDTFGAQFTVVEGETLRKTLGDPNKSPAEKKAVLSAFIEQKARNIEAAARQGGVVPQQPASQAVPDVSTMSDQELEAIINGQ
jgi:hypothetical protein